MNRPATTTIAVNATRASDTKRPVLRRLDREPRSAWLCCDIPAISLRGGRIIGERSASLGIKLPGCYLFCINYTKTSFPIATSWERKTHHPACCHPDSAPIHPDSALVILSEAKDLAKTHPLACCHPERSEGSHRENPLDNQSFSGYSFIY